MSPSKSSRSFLGLPAELRNQIYIEFLDRLVATSQRDPCSRSQDNDECVKSRDYVHFLLANRQVAGELGSLFARDYSSQVVATTTNPARLLTWAYKAAYSSGKCKPRTINPDQRFALHVWPSAEINNDGLDGRPRRPRRSSYPSTATLPPRLTTDDRALVTLLTAQPGFRTGLLQQPGLHRTEPAQWAETDQATIDLLGMPDCDYVPWLPEDAGFILVREASEDEAGSSDSVQHHDHDHTCRDHTRLIWPQWRSKCRLTTYAWTTAAGRQSCMVLEGRLSDLHVR